MAHLCKKIIRGRTYYYLRETQRIGKKVVLKWQKYLGTAETMEERFSDSSIDKESAKLYSLEFGSLFVLHELEKIIDTVGIIDSIVASSPREIGPSVGEYFLFAWMNRLLEPHSKRAMGAFFAQTDLGAFHAVRSRDLTSQRFWEKWNRVKESDLEAIAKAFVEKIWSFQKTTPECLLFDTTNYYTYFASTNASELAKRGKNKAGKHSLRQIGLALLIDRHTRLPLFYRPYPGNNHDSNAFHAIIDEMFGIMEGLSQTKQRLTIVFDKGMNSDDNMEFIDDNQRIHFITTYSTYFAEEFARVDLKEFSILQTPANLARKKDQVMAYRSHGEFWGKTRAVVVTFNPATQRKKQLVFEEKLERLRLILLEYRQKHREQLPQWRDFAKIQVRYEVACRQLHLGIEFFNLTKGNQDFSFRKNSYAVSQAQVSFGKNIIVTDNRDWSTEDIAQASLDRSMIEAQFRASKSSRRISTNPMFHWTDHKIRCHLLVCFIALTMNRLLEIKVEPHAGKLTGDRIISQMRTLHTVLKVKKGQKKAIREYVVPTVFQNVVLKIFGYKISQKLGLHAIPS